MSNWRIRTYSGRLVDPLEVTHADIDISDIAHALSQICRFTGHCKEFYSVAQHSVHVSESCVPEYALQGLLHDASEAYLQDIASPLKRSDVFALYRELEAKTQKLIYAHFGLPEEEPQEVKRADQELFHIEKISLMNTFHPVPEVKHIHPWHPLKAEKEFLERYKWLNSLHKLDSKTQENDKTLLPEQSVIFKQAKAASI